MFCPHCGESTGSGDSFCRSCGGRLGSVEVTEPHSYLDSDGKERIPLVSCEGCQQLISATAFACPRCGRHRDPSVDAKRFAKAAAQWTALVAAGLLNPAGAIVGGLAGVFLTKSGKTPRDIATKTAAIDSFPLGPDWLVFVTVDAFVLVLNVQFAAEGPWPRVPFEFVTDIRIDESLTSKHALSRRERVTIVIECSNMENKFQFEFTGKNARPLAEFACAKLRGYAF